MAYENKPRNPVNFDKAIQILDLLLERPKEVKRIAFETGVSKSSIRYVKEMFPLFFPGRRRSPHKDDDDVSDD